jgi:inorganic pyrophosphatase
MPIRNLLQKGNKFEIQAYKRPKNLADLRKTHVAFSGSPSKHPYDPQKIILVVDPFSSNTFYYEFKTDDITFAEALPSISIPDAEVISMVRIWVKKKSVGIRCSPFIVEAIGLS